MPNKEYKQIIIALILALILAGLSLLGLRYWHEGHATWVVKCLIIVLFIGKVLLKLFFFSKVRHMKSKLYKYVIISLCLSVVVALTLKYFHLEEADWVVEFMGVCAFIGKLFMNALRMVIVPLIVSSIICGVMRIGPEKNFGRLGLKTIIYYLTTICIAVLLGVAIVNIIRPGVIDVTTAKHLLGVSNAQAPAHVVTNLTNTSDTQLSNILLKIIPTNLISAASGNDQLLGLILFSILFGFFVTKLQPRYRIAQQLFWESIQKVMMMVTGVIIQMAPIGVFGLVTPIILRTGYDLLWPILMLTMTIVAGLLIYFFVVLSLFLRFWGKIRPIDHYKAMIPVILTAFSTASSASTIPVALEEVEKTSGVSNKIASFTISLGAIINMSGTALYECVVVLFIAQVYGVVQGIHFGIWDQLFVAVLSLLTSIGLAGVPSAGLVAITVILGLVGLPVEAVGVIWTVERVLDMMRTAVNVFSDTCGAIVIARSEGEITNYRSIK